MNKIILFLIIYFISINNVFSEDLKKHTLTELNEQEVIVEEEIIKIKDVKDINKANIVIIQALNKITAKSYRYEIKIGEEINFERIVIKPLFCWKSSPEDIPENKVLLKIKENKLDKTQSEIFYGWMFSSSPSISSVEHPMYDITVINCKNSEEVNIINK